MILVTGATGNISGHVIRQLAEKGVKVRAFVRDAKKGAGFPRPFFALPSRTNVKDLLLQAGSSASTGDDSGCHFICDATKSQLTRFQNASTYFGRRLR